jgi:hypothetical protein
MTMSSLTYIPDFYGNGQLKKFIFFVTAAILNGVLSDKILKGIHPRTSPSRFGLIWFSGFRGKDLNVILPGRDGPWVGPFHIYFRQLCPPFKMATVTKIEISSIVHCCFNINQNELKFLLQLHGNE